MSHATQPRRYISSETYSSHQINIDAIAGWRRRKIQSVCFACRGTHQIWNPCTNFSCSIYQYCLVFGCYRFHAFALRVMVNMAQRLNQLYSVCFIWAQLNPMQRHWSSVNIVRIGVFTLSVYISSLMVLVLFYCNNSRFTCPSGICFAWKSSGLC